MKKIKYVALYDIQSYENEKRAYSISAVNKMSYIIKALNDGGYNVQIISPLWTSLEKGRFSKRETKINERTELICGPTFGAKGFFRRKFRVIHSMYWLFSYLMKNTTKGENILVYHTVAFSLPVRLAKFFKKFRLILETEEVYNNATKLKFPLNVFEKKILRSADAYLFSTELLAKEFSTDKPYSCCYGMYSPTEILASPNNDGKIHLLYTGIIDSDKRGAFNAVDATEYLDENYVLHILGFGEVDKLNERIEELNKTNKCKIVFDGLLTGDGFIKYCQQCHIGLSTQTMTGDYLQTSFPSKVLSYMCMGLPVVSCYVECVFASKIGSLVTYYREDTPEAIAMAIRSMSTNTMLENIPAHMSELHLEFIREIDAVISNK